MKKSETQSAIIINDDLIINHQDSIDMQYIISLLKEESALLKNQIALKNIEINDLRSAILVKDQQVASIRSESKHLKEESQLINERYIQLVNHLNNTIEPSALTKNERLSLLIEMDSIISKNIQLKRTIQMQQISCKKLIEAFKNQTQIQERCFKQINKQLKMQNESNCLLISDLSQKIQGLQAYLRQIAQILSISTSLYYKNWKQIIINVKNLQTSMKNLEILYNQQRKQKEEMKNNLKKSLQ